jgi:hypothetical protein
MPERYLVDEDQAKFEGLLSRGRLARRRSGGSRLAVESSLQATTSALTSFEVLALEGSR